ncbi:hypothetical protein [Streptosporangium sp. NPDC023615]|uniref:hypothetical protein n=1 Tax=Streptosporangium sp. NPDC023615 TaxID=3154794 RepID=UPI0034344DDA
MFSRLALACAVLAAGAALMFPSAAQASSTRPDVHRATLVGEDVLPPFLRLR